MKKCKKNIFYRIWHWYIKGEYHCDKCPYSWEERTSYEYDEWDAGCYIKGYIHDTCRLLPPFRWIIGSLRVKKAEYYRNHEYDGFCEWYDRREAREKEMVRLINKHIIGGYELCWKDSEGEYHPINTEMSVRHEAASVCFQYEDFIGKQEAKENPYQNPWKKAIIWTWNRFIRFFMPYFCK